MLRSGCTLNVPLNAPFSKCHHLHIKLEESPLQEERDNFLNLVRPEVKQAGLTDTPDNCWDYFSKKVNVQPLVYVVLVLQHIARLNFDTRLKSGLLILNFGRSNGTCT